MRATVARALERDVERLVDESCGHGGVTSSSGSTTRAPSFSHSARRRSLRLAHDDVVDAERLQRGDRQEADRPAAGDEPARARPRAAACVMPCSATASGSVSAACLSERPSGTRSDLGGGDHLVAGERALPVAVVAADRGPARCRATAVRRGSTRTCRTAGSGPPTTRSPTAQPVTASPTATTVPAYSWPSIDVRTAASHSSRKWRSEPQMPQWLTSSSSSPGAGPGVGRSSTVDVAQGP